MLRSYYYWGQALAMDGFLLESVCYLWLESSVRLLNILFVSLVLVRTTSSEDWMGGLDKLLGPMSQRLPVVRELLAVAVMAVKFLPVIFAETEERFAELRKGKDERGLN